MGKWEQPTFLTYSCFRSIAFCLMFFVFALFSAFRFVFSLVLLFSHCFTSMFCSSSQVEIKYALDSLFFPSFSFTQFRRIIFHFEYLFQFISFHFAKNIIRFHNTIYLKYRSLSEVSESIFLFRRFLFTWQNYLCLCVVHFAFVDSVTGKIYHYSVNVQEKHTTVLCATTIFQYTTQKCLSIDQTARQPRIQLNVSAFD